VAAGFWYTEIGLFLRVFYKDSFFLELFFDFKPRVFLSLFKLCVLDFGDLLLDNDLFFAS
jgi:hypothetical protein